MEKKEFDERLLRPRDLTLKLNMSRSQVYNVMHSNGFPTIWIGCRMYAMESQVDKWLLAYTGKCYKL